MIRAMVAFISLFVRQCCLPNPFECFGNNGEVINLIVEPVIHLLAFYLVGEVYQRGESPILGSILYLFTYAVLTGILALMGLFSFAWWWVSIIGIAVVAAWVLLIKFRR